MLVQKRKQNTERHRKISCIENTVLLKVSKLSLIIE